MAEITRRAALAGAMALGVGAAAAGEGRAAQSRAHPFLVCHGAWSAGWAWRKMHPLLPGLHTPTMTGTGDRAHLASRAVDLALNIFDILSYVEMEDLRDIVLIGHSWGGMVATGVADRLGPRVRKLVYLDAFVPRDGESLFDLTGQSAGPDTPWLVPPRAIPDDTSAADRAWIMARRSPQPLATFTQKLRLANEAALPPRAYIRCTRAAPDDPLRGSAARARGAGWPYVEIDASHSPHVTAPALLARTLTRLARG